MQRTMNKRDTNMIDNRANICNIFFKINDFNKSLKLSNYHEIENTQQYVF